MLICGHQREAASVRVCEHLLEAESGFVQWYVSRGTDHEFVCSSCAKLREERASLSPQAKRICDECFDRLVDDSWYQIGMGGTPEVLTRNEPISNQFFETTLPAELGTIADISPIDGATTSSWILLGQDGRIARFCADSGEVYFLGEVTVPTEPERKPWSKRVMKRRLHCCNRGEFAAVVNDYGRSG